MLLLSPKSGMAPVVYSYVNCTLCSDLVSGDTFCTSLTLLVELHNFFWLTAPITGCFSPFCSCADDCSCLSTKSVPTDVFLLYFSFQINSATQDHLDFFKNLFSYSNVFTAPFCFMLGVNSISLCSDLHWSLIKPVLTGTWGCCSSHRSCQPGLTFWHFSPPFPTSQRVFDGSFPLSILTSSFKLC